jgi:pimeloyl-ACP methyl ester carboxylesterase
VLALGARAGDLASTPAEKVILLHGLGRTDWSMQLLADRISAAGFETHNIGYPSLDLELEQIVDYLDAEIDACCADAERLHFVTHSLGGILVRAYAAKHAPQNLRRVVMLAPPNHGSEYVDAMQEWALFRLAAGPTGVRLGTGADSLPNRLPVPEFEFGVIAGINNPNPVSEHVIPGASDGTVSVESTQLDGMSDFITVDESHTFIMRSPLVAEQTIAFLRNGRFTQPNPETR